MDFYILPPGEQKLWVAFHKYGFDTYADSPVKQADFELWFDELYARRQQDGLELHYDLIEHTTKSGLSFEAYTLCGQMRFSRRSLVKLQPQPFDPDQPHVHPEKLVGVHFIDYGKPDGAYNVCRRSALMLLTATRQDGIEYTRERIGSPYVSRIVDHIRESHQNAFALGLTRNGLDESWIRFAYENPVGNESHQDHKHYDRASSENAKLYTRTHSYAFDLRGTLYELGPEHQTLVPCPPHAMAVHYGGQLWSGGETEKGAWHRAQPSEEGRSVMMTAETPMPVIGTKNPWRIRSQIFGPV